MRKLLSYSLRNPISRTSGIVVKKHRNILNTVSYCGKMTVKLIFSGFEEHWLQNRDSLCPMLDSHLCQTDTFGGTDCTDTHKNRNSSCNLVYHYIKDVSHLILFLHVELTV